VDDLPDTGPYRDQIKWNQPFPMPEMTIHPAGKAYELVLEDAGATLPVRDPVDQRIVRMVKTGKAEYAEDMDSLDVPQFQHRRLPPDSYKMGIITDIRQVGGYPEYQGTPYLDSDQDGMPDAWEKRYQKLGLDPHDPGDALLDCNGDGYTNIEKYINGINPKRKKDWKDLRNNFDTLAKKGGL
jgi:hypothetical protein